MIKIKYYNFSLISLSSREQQSYSEGETDRSARTGDSETLKSSEIDDFGFSFFQWEGAKGAPGGTWEDLEASGWPGLKKLNTSQL